MLEIERTLRRRTPVYINNFNLPTYVGRMVDDLRRHGFANIVVIDQASTSAQCIALLAELERSADCRVIRMKRNSGPRHFFESFRYLLAGSHYIYTDPDIELPDPMPDDYLTRMIAISDRWRIGKVGCALDVSDHHLFDTMVAWQEGATAKTTVYEHELQFWRTPIDDDVYDADVDTTFALYNARWFRLRHFTRAVRLAGPYTAKHRPWYVDKRMPEDELAFYKESCRFSSWFNTDLSGATLFRDNIAMQFIKAVKLYRWRYWQAKARLHSFLWDSNVEASMQKFSNRRRPQARGMPRAG